MANRSILIDGEGHASISAFSERDGDSAMAAGMGQGKGGAGFPLGPLRRTGWGRGARKDLPFEHVLDAFDDRVAATPERPAVACGDARLTYAELDARANRLAQVLAECGVVRGDVVALLLPRGIDFIVAVLAVLKAGGGYMPLDLRSPASRLEAIVMRTRARLVLTSKALRERAPQGTPFLAVDEERVAAGSANPLDLPRDKGDLLYVISTSGSTGGPKNAAVAHYGFANLLNWYVQRLSLYEADRVLIVGATTFDASQKNLFAPFIVGGMLVFPEREDFDPEDLAEQIARHEITWINGTPSNIYPILEGPGVREPARLASLRWVVLGGEPINAARLMPWLRHELCSARILNTYGPTECTDICTSYAFNRFHGEGPVPLGEVIDNVRIAVVDGEGKRVATGEAGELLIGGIGVGLGYLGEPELNEKVFFESEVFGKKQRVYRTGDRVLVRPDGLVEFVGRMDCQVKLRGFRLELGEVEAALEARDGISAAAVVLRDDLGSEPGLVAFLTSDGTPRPSNEALRAELAQRLPDYAVPSFYIWLESLPLTANGKVDRNNLATRGLGVSTRAALSSRFKAEDGLESLVAAHWARIVGHDNFTLDDSFFDIGGSSLALAELQASLGRELGVAVPIVTMFANPTVRRLARALTAPAESVPPARAPEPEKRGGETDPNRLTRMKAVRRAR